MRSLPSEPKRTLSLDSRGLKHVTIPIEEIRQFGENLENLTSEEVASLPDMENGGLEAKSRSSTLPLAQSKEETDLPPLAFAGCQDPAIDFSSVRGGGGTCRHRRRKPAP